MSAITSSGEFRARRPGRFAGRAGRASATSSSAPIIGEAGPLGAIEVMSRRAQRVRRLRRGGPRRPRRAGRHRHHQRAPDRRAASARRRRSPAAPRPSGRCATSRPGSPPCTDPDEVLERVVEDARRLLATDGAHLTRMAPDRRATSSRSSSPAAADDATRDVADGHAVPARRRASTASPPSRVRRSGPSTTWPTRASRTSPTTTPSPTGSACAGMAAAPLRAPGGEVIGTLAVSTRRAAHVRGRRARPAAGPGRPGRHRADELEPPRPADARGGALPRPRPDDAGRHLAGRRGGHLHVHGRHRRGPVRLADRGDHRQALRVPDRPRLDGARAASGTGPSARPGPRSSACR